MSKGGQGAAAASVLMLKKSEDKRQESALRMAFKRADSNGDGILSVEEYQKILQEHNISTTKQEIVNLKETADKNVDGYITKSEIVVGQSKVGTSMEQKAEMAFKLMDRNNDGYITKQEMLGTTKKLNEKQVSAVFARNDKDGDGKLSKEEFKEMMCRVKK
eukprot:TRINITY_DN21083_c0_g1_i2.p1 TRINITY_DN21083_c0_g1~~TRINITY_DN21083_c0_g1_i2.p1  ORF type:complete len:161 (-),score=57.30 TRINITY_DN21083_c0_g1_i2:469-951(-)